MCLGLEKGYVLTYSAGGIARLSMFTTLHFHGVGNCVLFKAWPADIIRYLGRQPGSCYLVHPGIC